MSLRVASWSSVALVLGVVACGGAPERPVAAPPATADRASERLEQSLDVRDGVRTFTSTLRGFETNSYWLEGPTGVVVIDTQFLPSEAERLLDDISASTDKPVELAIVLHPNPDKFNGADVFRSRGIRVLTSAQVLADVPRVAAIRRRAFLSRFAPDYPTTDPVLEVFGDTDTTLDVGGMQLRLHVRGRGCSEAHVIVQWGQHVFPGDLIAAGTHAWLELGYVREWIERIDELERLGAGRVHPGRGPSGDATLLDAQREYLRRVLALVTAASPTEPPPDGAIEVLRERVIAAYPTLRYRVFLYGLRAVWRNEATRGDPAL